MSQKQHAYQCDWHMDQYPRECTCGVTGPRVWWMDLFPEDRAPTDRELEEARKEMAERSEEA